MAQTFMKKRLFPTTYQLCITDRRNDLAKEQTALLKQTEKSSGEANLNSPKHIKLIEEDKVLKILIFQTMP